MNKFRAWDLTNKKFVFIEGHGPLVDGKGNVWVMDGKGNIWFSDNLVVTWCTGYTDIFGKEVYEGDVVRYSFFGGGEDIKGKEDPRYADIVKFEKSEFLPRPRKFSCDNPFYSYEYYDFEVIGNVFERPEFLKK